MTTQISNTAIDVGESSARHHASVNEAHRLVNEGDQQMARYILDAKEMPLKESIIQQADATSDLISAAQAYRRDLLKLLALAGGYDRIEEA